jgi:hypothetical protein
LLHQRKSAWQYDARKDDNRENEPIQSTDLANQTPQDSPHAERHLDSLHVEQLWQIPVATYALTWIVQSWGDGLRGAEREGFLSVPVGKIIEQMPDEATGTAVG